MRRLFSAVIAAVLLLSAVVTGCASGEKEAKTKEITVGALLGITGDISSSGKASRAALQIAADEVNGYLASGGSSIRIAVLVEDTGADPAAALEKLKLLAERGVRVVIGPESSAELKEIKEYAGEKGILLISNESTAPSLAVAGDNVFRFVPDDVHQAEAVARMMWHDGIRATVPMWRGDVWGDDLSAATKAKFEQLGGKTLDGIRYSAVAGDYSKEIELLNEQVVLSIGRYGSAGSVGVYLSAFEEAVDILKEAKSYPFLSRVRWYGTDGTALNDTLQKVTEAARFAEAVGFTNPVVGETAGDKAAAVAGQIRQRSGVIADPYSLAAYDALWVIARSLVATGGTDELQALKAAFLKEAESYYGVTGSTSLNEAGDRESGNYDFWALRQNEGVFEWKRVAAFSPLSGLDVQAAQLSPAAKLKVLVVHSYHESWGWNKDISRGIVEGLARQGYLESSDYQLKTFYMDTKITYTSPDQIRQRAEMAIGIIDEFKPDIVFVNDDDALRSVGVEYTKRHPEKKLPIVFSGINVDPSVYEPVGNLDKPVGSITGALERFPYAEAFAMVKKISPTVRRIVLLADSSAVSTFIAGQFKEEYLKKVTDPSLEIIGPIQSKTFQEWKDNVMRYQTEADAIGIMTYHQLRDENGAVVAAPEVVDWTVSNSRLPEVGVLTFHAEDGYLGAVGASPYKTGVYVGVIGGQILDGAAPGSIPIVDPKVVDVVFNLERAQTLGLTIPAGDLSRASQVFQGDAKPRY